MNLYILTLWRPWGGYQPLAFSLCYFIIIIFYFENVTFLHAVVQVGGAGGARAPPSLSRNGHTINPDSMSFYIVNKGVGEIFGSSTNKM